MAKLRYPPRRSNISRIEPFKGINTSVTETQIDNSQSPDMLNMNIDERGALNKRTGYERVIPQPLGTGSTNGVFLYKKKDGSRYFLIAHGTKLYQTDRVPGESTVEAIWEDDDLTQAWEV